VTSDRLGQFLGLVILSGLALAMPILVAQRKSHELDPNRFAKHVGWFVLSAAGMLLMVSSRNLLVVFVSFELLLLGAHEVSRRSSGKLLEGFSLPGNLVASALIFLGLALFYAILGTLDLAGIEAGLASLTSPMEAAAPVAGLTLLIVGIVSSLVLLVHRAAATGQVNPVSLGVFAILAQVAVFGVLLRSTGWLLSLAKPVAVLFGVASVLGVMVGNALGLWSRGVGRVLAYCGLAHVGYMSLAIAAGGVEARSSVLLYLLVYTLMSLGVCTVVSIIEEGRGGWQGLVWTHPFSGLAMSLFLVSLAGLPPAAGFLARFYLFEAAVAADSFTLVAISLIGSFLGVYCYMRILLTLFRQAPTPTPKGRALGIGSRLALLVVSFAVVLIGIVPEPWLVLVRRAALGLF
jgi:NADH-quinone oxidoreductase subunit N